MSSFKFKKFEIQQDKCAMKIGTDTVLLGAWAAIAQASSILDIGTGTGILALMCAQRKPSSLIHAIEIEAQAYQQATENIQQSPWAKTIQTVHQSIQDYCKQPLLPSYDSIISNPPFFENKKSTSINNQERSTARITEQLSFQDLLDCILLLLKPSGNFSLILPIQEGNIFIQLALSKGFYLKQKIEVISRIGKDPNRLLIELVLAPTASHFSSLTIRNTGTVYHDYTKEYIDLHQDFYLSL